MTGKVYLVGAGPGNPELLTLRAFKLLKLADFVLHDDLIPAEILELVPSSTKLLNVGKRFGNKRISQEEINGLMARECAAGSTGSSAQEWRPAYLWSCGRRN